MKGFQCLNPDCTNFLFVTAKSIEGEFRVDCPKCGFVIEAGGTTELFDYELMNTDDQSIIEDGTFEISHDEYISQAEEFKYCILCCTLKPLSLFDAHGSRESSKQGECRQCKKEYNALKNPTRTSDQHREAGEMRRLLVQVAGKGHVDSSAIRKKYNNKCFKCGKDLGQVAAEKERPIDHTLPVYYLWPLKTESATLLCKEHNGEKTGKWPSEYYTDAELRSLSRLTGIDYEILSGEPQYNQAVIDLLHKPDYVDQVIEKNAAHMRELQLLRRRLVRDLGFDFFMYASAISPTLLDSETWLASHRVGTGPVITEESDTDVT